MARGEAIGPVSRRTVLGAAAAAAAGPSSAAGQARPNILWLVSEDNNPWLGCYGEPLARTPAIDRLAAEGLLYRQAYSTAPVCAPSRFALITGMRAESCAPAHQMRARARLPAFATALPRLLAQAGYYCSNNAKTDYNCDLDPAATWSAQGLSAHWKDRPDGAPFFAVFNHETTHESQLFKPTPGRVKPQDVDVPAYLPDTLGVRTDIASYHNRIAVMDAQIGARLAELEAAGLAEDTIVFHYADNGGALPRTKRYCYDEGLHCGLIVRVPPKWAHLLTARPGARIDDPVTLVDLPATVLMAAGEPIPAHFQGRPLPGLRGGVRRTWAFGGRDRMDERYDLVRTVTDGRFRYIRNYAPHRPWGQHGAYQWQMVAWQDWETEHAAGRLNPAQAQFWGAKPAEELYDLQADPDQVANLATTAAQRTRLAAMRRQLDAHMLSIRDGAFIPEGSALEDYAAQQDEGRYPLRRAMALAARCIARDPANAAGFVTGLSDDSEVIRFWSAQGLLMLARQATWAAPAMTARLKAERSPQVRVVLAEALTHMGPPDAPLAMLAELSAHEHPRVRLQAINALTYAPDASPALAAVEAAVRDKDGYVRTAARYLALVLRGEYRPDVKVFD